MQECRRNQRWTSIKQRKGIEIDKELESQVSSNEKELKSIRNLTESLSDNFEKLNGDMHEANVKIDGLEGDVKKILKVGGLIERKNYGS